MLMKVRNRSLFTFPPALSDGGHPGAGLQGTPRQTKQGPKKQLRQAPIVVIRAA